MAIFSLWRILMLCICTLATASAPAQAQSIPENDRKAAFIYNFILFTDWPDQSQADSRAFTICVNAASAMRPALTSLHGKMAKGRRLTVKLLEAFDDGIRECGVLLVDGMDRDQWLQLKKNLAKLPVLTISIEGELGSEHAMVALGQSWRSLVFDVDMAAVRQANLVMSSKLLRLARVAQ